MPLRYSTTDLIGDNNTCICTTYSTQYLIGDYEARICITLSTTYFIGFCNSRTCATFSKTDMIVCNVFVQFTVQHICYPESLLRSKHCYRCTGIALASIRHKFYDVKNLQQIVLSVFRTFCAKRTRNIYCLGRYFREKLANL